MAFSETGGKLRALVSVYVDDGLAAGNASIHATWTEMQKLLFFGKWESVNRCEVLRPPAPPTAPGLDRELIRSLQCRARRPPARQRLPKTLRSVNALIRRARRTSTRIIHRLDCSITDVFFIAGSDAVLAERPGSSGRNSSGKMCDTACAPSHVHPPDSAATGKLPRFQ